MKSLILFATVFVLANADSNILRRIKPVLMMGETILQMKDKNQCLQKSFCILETLVDKHIMNPLSHFSQFLTNRHLDFDPKDFEKINEMMKSYPKYTEIINSILFGRKYNSTASCSQQFPLCSVTEGDIINELKSFDDEHVLKNLLNKSTKRNKACDGVGIGCGVVGVGCAFCEVATEGICAVACAPATGAACSGAGLGCIFG